MTQHEIDDASGDDHGPVTTAELATFGRLIDAKNDFPLAYRLTLSDEGLFQLWGDAEDGEWEFLESLSIPANTPAAQTQELADAWVELRGVLDALGLGDISATSMLRFVAAATAVSAALPPADDDAG